jgi:hypothetical protein
MAVKIRKDLILDNWVSIIDNGGGNHERIYSATESYLEQSKLPAGVTWKRDDVSAGFASTPRQFLIVNFIMLREYTMFLCARDFGNHLDCGWFLLCQPGILKRAFSKSATGNPTALSMGLDVFSQQDLSAWTGVVHHAFMSAIQDLMEDLKQDTSRMNTTSKGFLSVW